MRILLDEDVPVKLRHAFPSSFVVETVTYRGWDSLDNGALWEQAQQEFDAIVTLDRGVTDQRNLDRCDLAVVVMKAGLGRYPELQPLVPRVVEALLRREDEMVIIAEEQ
jgi:predicted nuclease of predicted toxin-antitoxin system